MPAVAHHEGASTSRQTTTQKKRKSGSSARDEKQYIGQWRIGRTIGKGSSGRVKIAKHAVTGKYAAIKIVPKGLILNSRMSMSEAGAKADKVLLGIEREIVIMKLIDHPNVLNLYDVWETSSELFLIMEYVPGGELFDYLVKRGRLPVSEALHYFQQIIFAVDYCHRFNICHRDLKPENLLLDKDKNIKVADFGMAAWEAGERMLETSCGSPHYASPEIVSGKAYHGSSSDIWSCGIILFALLTGRLPFDDDNIRSLLQKVKIGVFEMPDEIKDPARDLLKRMLERDPESRITMPKILNHPFFVSRPPRPIPGRSLVSPPSLDEVARPVNSVTEIDPDIMNNLKTLWHGAPDQEIIDNLMCKEQVIPNKTWEKTIYHLLVKYRSKHLENFNTEEEELAAKRERRSGRKQSQSSPAKRKDAPRSVPPIRLVPLGENETISNTPAKRPQAPTPNKASRKTPTEPSIPNKLLTATRNSTGPRSPADKITPANDDDPQAVTIVLHGATPRKEVPPHIATSYPQSEVISAPTSPISLNVPQVEDANLQIFLNQIADQMNRISVRSSVASQSSDNSVILNSDYQACLAFAAGVGHTNTQMSTVSKLTPEEQGQFEDAADDQTDVEVASIHSYAASMGPQQKSVAALGLGSSPMNRPALQSVSDSKQQRWSYASSTGSSYRVTSTSAYSPIDSPQYNYGHSDTHSPTYQTDRYSFHPSPSFATRSALSATWSRPLSSHPVLDDPVESLLQRDTSYVIIENSELPMDSSVSSWGSKSSGGFRAHRSLDGFGKLRRKKLTIDPVPYSPDSVGLASAASSPLNFNTPKRPWFMNLFSSRALGGKV
nr:CAMK/CAMKL/GIN4 protein kinase [Cryptococcus depauperatus CBS 7855]